MNSVGLGKLTAGGTTNERTVKIVVVGDPVYGSSSGQDYKSSKTELLQAFLRRITGQYAVFLSKDKAVDFPINGTNVKLFLWDTTGEEEDNQLCVQAFAYSNAVLLTFVVDDRQSFDNVVKWHQLIRQYLPTEPIVLVGLRMEQRYSVHRVYQMKHQQSTSPVSYSEGLAMAQKLKCHYEESSAALTTNVAELLVIAVSLVLWPTKDFLKELKNKTKKDETLKTKEKKQFEKLFSKEEKLRKKEDKETLHAKKRLSGSISSSPVSLPSSPLIQPPKLPPPIRSNSVDFVKVASSYSTPRPNAPGAVITPISPGLPRTYSDPTPSTPPQSYNTGTLRRVSDPPISPLSPRNPPTMRPPRRLSPPLPGSPRPQMVQQQTISPPGSLLRKDSSPFLTTPRRPVQGSPSPTPSPSAEMRRKEFEIAQLRAQVQNQEEIIFTLAGGSQRRLNPPPMLPQQPAPAMHYHPVPAPPKLPAQQLPQQRQHYHPMSPSSTMSLLPPGPPSVSSLGSSPDIGAISHLDKDVMMWTVEDVCNWLQEQRLEAEVLEVFASNKINGVALIELSEEDLRNELKLKLGPCKQLVRQIRELKELASSQQELAAKKIQRSFRRSLRKKATTRPSILSGNSFLGSDNSDNSGPSSPSSPLWASSASPPPVPSRSPTRTNSDSWEIPWEHLSISEQIGEGAFGVVYMGVWNHRQVAIKKLRTQTLHATLMKDLLLEVAIMKKLADNPHENIVTIHGWCTQPPNMCIVTEFCSLGCLGDNFNLLETPADMFTVITGIAKGMQFLHETTRICHRDLACRNILLSRDEYQCLVPKITDFGMSRFSIAPVNQTITNQFSLKWSAPETLRDFFYSEKSDVWSFGVTVIEILLKGDPYPNYPDQAVAIAVRDRKLHPEIPGYCVSDLKELLERCWNFEPEGRPSFCDIVADLAAIRTPLWSPPSSPSSTVGQ